MRWMRRAAVGAALGVVVSVVTAVPAHAAATGNAWVSTYAINFQAGAGAQNSVVTKKVVNSSGTWWQFTDVVAIKPGAGCHYPYRGTNTLVWCTTSFALMIVVSTGDGADAVTIETPATVVQAGAGDDVVRTVADASIFTVVYGEDGADTFLSGLSRDTLNGGPGQDTVSYADRTGQLWLSLETAAGGPRAPNGGGNLVEDTYVGVENLTGGVALDVLFGDAGANVLAGGPGDSVIYGGSGNDTVIGASQYDLFYAGDGDDLMLGLDGPDVLFGDAGNDTFIAGNGYDLCFPDAGESISGCESVSYFQA